MEANFINLGEVDPHKINRLYNAADIFCLPSHSEGIANCVAEAMSTGLPVLTTNVCGHPEIINSGVNGILVPPHNPGILTEALFALINDAGQREALGNNARNFIVNEWGNYTENAAKIYEIFERALSK